MENSRDMHQSRSADSRFRTLGLFARRQEKLRRHIRRILLPSRTRRRPMQHAACP